jgi:PAS domain-containing protein
MFLLDKLPTLLKAAGPKPQRAMRAATVLANTPFLLTRCNSDLRYLFISEACARMLGRRPEEVIGKKSSKS